MNGTAPPFDPSKPFTTEGGPPSFDPSKPFTQEGASSAAQGPRPGVLSQIGHGFEAPFVGMDVLASEAEKYIPGMGSTAAHDIALAQQEKQSYEGGSTGSGWEILGNLANPFNYLPGPLSIKGAGFFPAVARGLEQGATSSIVQPEHSPGRVLAGTAAGGAASAIAEPLVKAIAGNSAADIDKFIQEQYQSRIKPSVKGRNTISQEQRYQDQVLNGINAIVSNKPNLRLVDEFGAVTGRLPETLDEFQQALEQTKQKVFAAYDQRAKAAGQAFGGRNMVSLMPIVGDLQTIANSVVVRDMSPGVTNLAQQMADRLHARGSYTTEEAQQLIQHLNAQLRGFYSSAPTRETIGASHLEAMVASKLREGLDATIERATGPGYQDLKNQYGALRRLEEDVVRRAAVTARQEPGRGLMGRIGDVIGVHDVLSGILHADPARFAVGTGLRLFTGEMRRLRSPNRAVRRIFEQAEKRAAGGASPARQPVAAAVQRAAPVAGAVSLNNMLGYMQ